MTPALVPDRRTLAAVTLLAIAAALLLAAVPASGSAPIDSAEAPVRREAAPDVVPPTAGESTVTLTFRDGDTPVARSAATRLAAERTDVVRSEAHAAARRALLAATRLPADLRTAAGRAVRSLAAEHGLRVLDEGQGHVTLAGPADRLADAFGTTLREVPSGATSLRVAASDLVVPATLAPFVRSAHGLDDRPAVRRRAIPFGYEGHHLRDAYDALPTSRNGAGTTVGILQFSGWDASDLTTYAAAAGIPLASGQITEVALNGANPAQHDGSGGAFEVAMDSEAVLAAAPAARQRIYFTTNNFAGAVAVYSRMAQDAEAGLLTVASTSWGSCEQINSATVAAELASHIRRIVAAGATLTAASGDAGAYGCSTASQPDSRLAVDFPAAVPEVLAVGGTTLPWVDSNSGNFNPNVQAERAWGVNAGTFPAYQGDGSGGGASIRYPRPAYQASIALPGNTRLVPDLAAVADAETGLAVYVGSQGGWLLGGGTSLASPIIAGLLADAASDAGRTSGPGDIHGAIYVNQQAFRDIATGGNNGFAATDGYDLVTGLGAPRMDLLAPAIGLPPIVASPSPSPTPSSASPTPTPSPTPSSASPTPSQSPTSIPQAPTLSAPTTAVAGVLITVTGTAAPGAEVELWGVTAPNGTITRVNTPTVLADANGFWAKTIRPLRNVNLQARVGPSMSGTRFIAVSTAVRQSVSPLAGCVVQVSGAVFEPKPGATVFIRARDSLGRTVSLGTGLVEGDGRFLLRKPYACGQQLGVYTVISGDNVNRPGATGTQTITTRR
ncbi:MAG TPA: S53 family peptidase [Mycobacteriales bacterium]|nr:S53 family peptidase [Mycobacteriales bacterium]